MFFKVSMWVAGFLKFLSYWKQQKPPIWAQMGSLGNVCFTNIQLKTFEGTRFPHLKHWLLEPSSSPGWSDPKLLEWNARAALRWDVHRWVVGIHLHMSVFLCPQIVIDYRAIELVHRVLKFQWSAEWCLCDLNQTKLICSTKSDHWSENVP